jgi:beta-xylosidase
VAAATVTALAGGVFAIVNAPAASAATIDTSASYVLVNRNSGKALDVYNLATTDGARITQWSRNDGSQQQWQFVDSGGGYYRLKSRLSGKVLDVYNRSTADGGSIVQWTDNNGTNQQFSIQDIDGYIQLINRNSGKAVEVQGASTADGGNVVQYSDWNGANQQWQLVQVGSGTPPTGPSTPPPTGSFTNPVVWQDFADGDIIRVGDTYYYSASTMHYSPGAPVLRSYDLVNWEYAGHSVPRLDFDNNAYDLNGARAYVKGIWASAFNHRPSTNTFYWLGCTEFNRTYVYTSTTAGNGWSKKARINKCYYDAGLMFDNDTPYVAYGNGTISVAQL